LKKLWRSWKATKSRRFKSFCDLKKTRFFNCINVAFVKERAICMNFRTCFWADQRTLAIFFITYLFMWRANIF
jgi:hypothetical protein